MIAKGCDIAIASDPDADRMAALIKHGDGNRPPQRKMSSPLLLLDHLLTNQATAKKRAP